MKKSIDGAATSTGPLLYPLSFLLLGLLAFFSIYSQQPPSPVPSTAEAREFSADRAMTHIEAIAGRPRPVGSAEHAAARDYIFGVLTSLGFSPEIQRVTVVGKMRGVAVIAGSVENVVARLKGEGSGKAVMLVGHYDSVPTSPGASDDGSAVAAMLETARALKAATPLTNDIILLFSDSEEVGLLGAQAFVREHPWAADVGVVLNFDARGNSGPAMMFETSSGNGRLIREFAQAVPYPLANSLSYEIYKRLPNDTDLTVFKQAGLAGLNFAYIKGLTHYHTSLDTVENLDQRSLQHQGTNALALARQFGNAQLNAQAEPDAVYFNTFGYSLIYYSARWVIPVAILVTLVFVGIAIIGLRKRLLTPGGSALGFLAFLLSAALAPLAVELAWRLLMVLHPNYRIVPPSESYGSDLFLWGFILLSLAVVSTIYLLFGKRVASANLMMGGLFAWLLLLISSSLFVPGASYLFAWPLFFMLVGLGIVFTSGYREPVSLKSLVVMMICAIPLIVLLAPMIYNMHVALTLNDSSTVALLVALMLALLVPHLGFLDAPKRWALPVVCALLSLALIVAANWSQNSGRSSFNQTSIFYALNADTGAASWGSSDSAPNEWTAQFFSGKAEARKMAEFFPGFGGTFLQAQAPAAPLESPQVTLLGDETSNGIRFLRMRVTSPRQAPIITVLVEPGTETVGMSVNGKRIERAPSTAGAAQTTPFGVRYYAPPAEGLDLTLDVRPSPSLKLRVIEQSYGLPDLQGVVYQPRPDSMVLAPVSFNNATIVSKSFSF